MKIIFRLYEVKFTENTQFGWINTENLIKIITSFQQAGLWEWFRFYKKLGKKRIQRLSSVDSLIQESQSWKLGTYIFSADIESDDLSLDITLGKQSFNIILFVAKDYLSFYKNDLLNKISNFICALHTKFKDIALIGPSINIDIFDVPFKQVYPPRAIHYLGNSSVINYVSKKFFQQDQNFEYEKFERLLTLPMPEGCYREERGDLVIFRWVEHLNDNEYLQERLAIRQQWLVEAIDPPIDSLYNSLGDRRIFLPDTAIRNEFVTRYDPRTEAGYKAFLVDYDWTIDEELFAEMASWLRYGKLPDGKPLKKLYILVPDRECALFIYERAKTIGIEGIYYHGNSAKVLWNPFVTDI